MGASAHLKTHTPKQSHQTPSPLTSKRRKRRDTAAAAAAAAAPPPSSPDVVSSDAAPWCCAPLSSPPPPTPTPPPHRALPLPPPLDSDPMEAAAANTAPSYPACAPPYPSSYSKFNSALNAGLLNPMSPPPTRSSPTLFDMMANEHDYHPRSVAAAAAAAAAAPPPPPPPLPQLRAESRQAQLQERVAELLGSRSPGSQFNDPESSDVRLTLASKDGLAVCLSVHRHILVAHSRFFAAKLSDRWSRQQRALPHVVEISDCDDVEVYIETLRLMYCKDLRRRLMKEDVAKVLGILKVSAAIVFDAGVLSCLEYLEAAPWAEDEDEKVASLLTQLRLESSGAGEVLKRVSLEAGPSSAADEASGNGGAGEEILVRLLHVVLEGKDEKARREMKGLVSKMLRESNGVAAPPSSSSASGGDLSKDSLYAACDGCLRLLRHHFLRAAAAPAPPVASSDPSDTAQIARQADNLHWMLDILVDRQIADHFLTTWAAEAELAELHPKVPAIHRFEVSRVTARLFVGVGKGQILASKEARCLLLKTWLEPFYEDFGWMRRACKGLDRHLVEDGLANTILTLPLAMQQEILLAWFDRFLNSGEDCPNIQRGFEVWWRRAFWRRNGEPEPPPQLSITAVSENSC
ncbi:BTB/POZ domain-containing protein At1g63850 [Ananas comosus]|uniref:BTB/POZ domain-containing protein At1g63850 n=1 Tax=Ananas comosus TaxID=4615 RepID=A0A6P5EMX3_ANACO|nr:BTB/POZ domain-containing protein At1g63850 [Ananas comosus]